MNKHKHRNLNQKGVLLMTPNWKTMRNTLVWLIVAVITMGIVISSPYIIKSSAASLPTVQSCKGLTVKKSGNAWYTFNAKNQRVSYTGLAENSYGWWRTENGKVNFNATGVYNNDYGWYRVEKGKVNFKAGGIYKNAYGWWKTSKGKVTFKENGVFKNENGWWKVKDSKVDFDFEGVASNPYGTWYLEKGKVDFGKNGTTNYEGKNYYVIDGKAFEAPIMDSLIKIVEDIASDENVSKEIVRFLMTDKESVDVLAEEYKVDPSYFTKDYVSVAIDKAEVNWVDEAFDFCVDVLLDDDDPDKSTGTSRAFLKDFMVTPYAKNGMGFDKATADAALAKVDQDEGIWDRQAEAAAKNVLGDWTKEEYFGLSESLYDEVMKELEFTQAESDTAKAKASSIDGFWKEQCRAAANLFKEECKPGEFTKQTLKEFLTGLEFTTNQVQNIVDEFFPNK